MSKIELNTELLNYCVEHGVRENEILRQLRKATSELSNRQMLITPDQGALMAMIARIMNAKRYLEIGMFTGYSALWMALSMPKDAYIATLDINDKYLHLAQEYWTNADVADKITPLIGAATSSLEQMIAAKTELFDIAFVDANKSQYIEYYEMCLQLVRPGGMIIIDNVLMYGQILEESPRKNYVKILQKLNKLLKDDNRVDICLLPIGDGMTLAQKRST